ncbi:11211_t:CDS:2, partial [Funneliformis mosseae]
SPLDWTSPLGPKSNSPLLGIGQDPVPHFHIPNEITSSNTKHRECLFIKDGSFTNRNKLTEL